MRRKVDKELIIEKGLELMCVNGVENTGIKEIADATGILKGSFYNYFENKEAFVKEVLDTYSKEVNIFMTSALTNAEVLPLKRIENLFDHFWKNISTNCNYGKGCFIGNCSQELGDTNLALSLDVNTAFVVQKKLFVVCLNEARAQGALDVSADVDQLAEFMINSWQGVLLRSKSAKNNVAYDSFKEFIFKRLLK